MVWPVDASGAGVVSTALTSWTSSGISQFPCQTAFLASQSVGYYGSLVYIFTGSAVTSETVIKWRFHPNIRNSNLAAPAVLVVQPLTLAGITFALVLGAIIEIEFFATH